MQLQKQGAQLKQQEVQLKAKTKVLAKLKAGDSRQSTLATVAKQGAQLQASGAK